MTQRRHYNNMQILDSVNRKERREWYQVVQVGERDEIKMETSE